jgi:hypothetical protein
MMDNHMALVAPFIHRVRGLHEKRQAQRECQNFDKVQMVGMLRHSRLERRPRLEGAGWIT